MNRELSLEEVHKETLNVLKKIDDICEHNDIKYSIMYGTLIGYMRHNGFIPWDDDMDVCMLRPEYDKFVAYCNEHEEELYPFKLMSKYTADDYPFNLQRFCDTRFKMVKTDGLSDAGMGLFIDIYPLDALGNVKNGAKKQIEKKKTFWMQCVGCAQSKNIMGTNKSFVKRLLRFPVYLYSHMKGTKYFLDKFDMLTNSYSYEDSKYVGDLIWDNCVTYYEKEWFEDVEDIIFEGVKTKIPVQTKKVLEEEYGDYMTPPPEEERVPYHEYIIYRK